jgi:hypothetical protein
VKSPAHRLGQTGGVVDLLDVLGERAVKVGVVDFERPRGKAYRG